MARFLNLPREQAADKRQHIEHQVTTLRNTAEMMNNPVQGLQGARMHSAEHAIQTLLLAARLKNLEAVAETMELCLGLCFPWLVGHTEEMLRSHKTMSKSTISWHQLTLDVAFMQVTAADADSDGRLRRLGMSRDPRLLSPEKGQQSRGVLVDASPYRGREVLLQESVSVDTSTMLEALAAMEQVIDADLKDPSAIDALSQDEAAAMQRLHASMRSVVRRHMHPPCFLGAHELSPLLKTQAFLHSISLESTCLDSLVGWASTVGSFTCDMVTEKGMGLLPNIPITQMMQSWRFVPELIIEDVGGAGGDHLGGPAPAVGPAALADQFSHGQSSSRG